MDENKRIDVAVIGGGIVGCAVSMALTKQPGLAVAIIEREETLAGHQTGNNSGVIHSGLYYRPGSLKAKNCVAGREALFSFCETHHIPHERCGKIVVATRPEELRPLETLEKRGRANGLRGLKRIGPEEIREIEPNVQGMAGLQVPDAGIVDYVAVTEAYAQKAIDAGAALWLGTSFLGCRRERGGLVLETTKGRILAKNLINCAGLQSDRVARRCGVNPGLRIIPFRGEYYELKPEKAYLVKHLVYPVPDSRYPFLGVHFTRMIHGGIEAGPNAVLALKREGYTWADVSLRDICSYLFYLGFWRMALRYWRTGFGEVARSLSKHVFITALRQLVWDLRVSDVKRAGAGVRAQALDPSGALVDDFRILRGDRMIHVLNAPSPAATAAIAIGRTIADLAIQHFNLT